MTPNFSFASLAYTSVTWLHRQQRKKKKKQKKQQDKIQNPTTERKANLHLDVQKTWKLPNNTFLIYMDIKMLIFFFFFI